MKTPRSQGGSQTLPTEFRYEFNPEENDGLSFNLPEQVCLPFPKCVK